MGISKRARALRAWMLNESDATSREVFERSREASGSRGLEAQPPRTLRFARSALPAPRNQFEY